MGRNVRIVAAALAAAMSLGGQAVAQLPDGAFPALSSASRPGGEAERLRVRAVAERAQVAPGGRLHLAVLGELDDGWVYYSPAPGRSGDYEPIGAGVQIDASSLRAGEPLWQLDALHESDLGGQVYRNYAYERRVAVFVPLEAPRDLPPGRYRVTVRLTGQVCGEGVCMDLRARQGALAQAEIVVAGAPTPNPAWQAERLDAALAAAVPAETLRQGRSVPRPAETAAGSEYTVAGGLALALLAGLILNLMPCVLPIIPLRILSVVEMARGSRRRYVTLGLAFAAGIVLFFAMLAGVNLVLHAALGRVFHWSEHFQSFPVRAGMAMVLLAVAANFFGLFHVTVPRRLAALEASPTGAARGEHARSVGMGLMMAILSTPCSFGVLLAALAWAQGVSPLLGSAALLLIGVGMAVPHALLAAVPAALRLLPRPGAWMERFRQAMGFVLLPVVVWLLSTVSDHADAAYLARLVDFAVALAFALWVWGAWVAYDAPLRRKLIVRGLAVALAVAAGLWLLPRPAPLATHFEPYDAARLSAARRQGRPVVVKFTAAWCLSCKVVDLRVYDDAEVARALRDAGALALKGDVTDYDSPAAAVLRDEFRASPPLTVLYPPGEAAPILLPGEMSKGEFLAALRRATGGARAAGGGSAVARAARVCYTARRSQLVPAAVEGFHP